MLTRNISTGVTHSKVYRYRYRPIYPPPIRKCLAYIDTPLTMFFRRWPAGLVEAVNAVNDGGRCWPEFNTWGVRIITQRPTTEAIFKLDEAALAYGGVLSRVDVHYDLFPEDESDLPELWRWLPAQLAMKHRRRGAMHDFDGEGTTLNWIKQVGRKRTSKRDVMGYADKLSKLTEQACCQFELRLQTSAAIKDARISRPSDLLAINPAELFKRYLRIVGFDWSAWEANWIARTTRTVMQECRQSHATIEAGWQQSYQKYHGKKLPKKLLARMEQRRDDYEQLLPRRVAGHVKRLTRYRLQSLQDMFAVKLKGEVDGVAALMLPTKTEGAPIDLFRDLIREGQLEHLS